MDSQAIDDLKGQNRMLATARIRNQGNNQGQFALDLLLLLGRER